MFANTLNPRQCKVVALPAPTERERGQWYFQRYAAHLPARGEISLFDRSWYNRAGVERVMGYCSEEEAEAFLKAAPEFERHLVDEGILLFKYWLCCDQEKQEERFAARINNPLRRWKLSPIDVEARTRYDDYTEARERMLEATHTPHAPWTLIDFNDQALGRLTLAARPARPAARHRTAAKQDRLARTVRRRRDANASECFSRSRPSRCIRSD